MNQTKKVKQATMKNFREENKKKSFMEHKSRNISE